MTYAEFAQRAAAVLGSDCVQTAIARAMGVRGLEVARWKLTGVVPEWAETKLAKLEIGTVRRLRDEWIIGTDAEGLREYIIHTVAPRFIGKLLREVPQEYATDVEAPPVRQLQADELFAEIVWLDRTPNSQSEFARLRMRAAAALEIYRADIQGRPRGL